MAETAELPEAPDVPAGSDEVTAAAPEASLPEASESSGAVAAAEAAGPDDGAKVQGAAGESKGAGAGPDEPGGAAGSGGAAASRGTEGLDGPASPDDRRERGGSDGAGSAVGSGGAGGPGGAGIPRWPGGYGDGDGDDAGGEDELRLLLHSAVDGLEPAPGTLQYLQRAVPARRTRRRQLVTVAAVAVVALAVSVPTLMNVAGSTSEKNPRQGVANSQLPGAGQQGGGGAVEGNDTDATAGSEEPSEKEEKTESPGHDENTAAPTGGSEGGTAAAEPCAPTQISEPVAASGTPDEAGRVTGSFTVTNVSTTACVVESSEGVRVGGTFGAANASAVDTRTHTAGDAATDLLPPPEATGALVLAPNESYVVEFAWVPETSTDGGCTTTATTPTPDPTDDTQSSPDETQSETDQGTETGGDTGGTGEPGEGDGTTDGSVTLTHSPEADSSAVASITVQNACAGTVYYTEPLPGA
ncbi:hypothetical protein [Streptomyces sp. NPDC004134]|uniref:hypothetical protein n=1 Tax=Streptomyces sp. NPDC004134 TaxID=3364691 RepID=UPI0036CDBE87